MKNYLKWILVLAIFFVLIFLLGHKPAEHASFIKIAGEKVKVEIVSTSEDQARGLSGRQSLTENEGMLFIFNTPGRYGFWMKDMLFPIDIIWLAPSKGGDVGELQVVYIKKDARPESYPQIFQNDLEAKYVLEVVSGFADKNNLKVGDPAAFTSPISY